MGHRLRIGDPAGQSFQRKSQMGTFLLKVSCVLAVSLLLRVVDQLPSQSPKVGKVADDESFHHRWGRSSQIPGDGSTPVVANCDRLFLTQVVNDSHDVAGQYRHGVVLHAFGLIAVVVPPEIDGHHLKLVCVLAVRYLSKADYGALAYALSVVSMGASVSLLGLNRGVNRFVPIYDEHRDYDRMFGTIFMAMGAVIGLGIALTMLVFGVQGFLTRSVASDPLTVGLLLILISLVPIQALDNLFQGMVAIFVGARSIFLRRHVLGPGLKLVAVLLVIALQGSVHVLAACYLAAGLLGLSIYVVMLYRVLHKQGLLANLSLRRITMPIRRIFGFSLPLLSVDILLTLKLTMAVMVLEYFRGSTDVAELRAIVSVAGLCTVVFQSLKFLFTPMASRLFARSDEAGIRDLYWRSAIWTPS